MPIRRTSRTGSRGYAVSVVKWVVILGLSLPALGPFAASEAKAAPSASKCSGPGPFALRINPDLLREDLRVEPLDEPRFSRAPNRNPGQEKQAQRGVCQDPKS